MKVVRIFRSRDNKEKCKTSTQAWFCMQAFSGHEKIKHLGCCLELFSKEGRSSFSFQLTLSWRLDLIIFENNHLTTVHSKALVCLFFRLIYFNAGLYTAPNVTLPDFAHHHNYHLQYKAPTLSSEHPYILQFNVEVLNESLTGKHRKNCECCPGHYLIVNHASSMSWFKFCNLSVIVNCVTQSLIH